MTIDNRQQKLARHVWEWLEGKKVDTGKISNTANGLPAMLQNGGLIQTIAYLRSKHPYVKGANVDKGDKKHFLQLATFLLVQTKSPEVLGEQEWSEENFKELFSLDFNQLRIREAYARSYLDWIKQLARSTANSDTTSAKAQ
ncbi:type III-B CRISPR module-associated protein Cmr5 [Alteromonas gilva]|uniref:CRISPR type III-B/RAMP module-associated protein Cmr5 n=1 Tax=Alteromonas gilva TaxID=2987522 RepID=A0ABT5L871_9ALTE|nr:type III-B CRISPR module-associated protein Cmr5 [Alteromonas gilva]MDC8832072.1 type III-B CRISPR module-associated protein Cmr5 [Alteromonas gilva]